MTVAYPPARRPRSVHGPRPDHDHHPQRHRHGGGEVLTSPGKISGKRARCSRRAIRRRHGGDHRGSRGGDPGKRGEIRTQCEVRRCSSKTAGPRASASRRKATPTRGVPHHGTESLLADRVVCALPIYSLSRIIDFDPRTSPLPRWWLKRITDIANEITGRRLHDRALRARRRSRETMLPHSTQTKHAGLSFRPSPHPIFRTVGPPGQQLLHTDIVCEHADGPTSSNGKGSEPSVDDLKEMFPESKGSWNGSCPILDG
jgi:hypothetical protein